MRLSVGSVFTGFGGLDLGLKWAGFDIKWQVEIEDYANRILQQHFKESEQFRDARHFPPPSYSAWLLHKWQERFGVDLMCGGFPCQGISNAGKRKGLEDERSGLWCEFIRIVRLLGPRFVLVENVGSLRARGLGQVLQDLGESGFDAEWSTIPASAFGFPHKRERLFIFGHASRLGLERGIITAATGQKPAAPLDYGNNRVFVSEPFGIRTTDGFPHYVEQITGLGNAVVPQVSEFVGRRIIESISHQQN